MAKVLIKALYDNTVADTAKQKSLTVTLNDDSTVTVKPGEEAEVLLPLKTVAEAS